jgi:predicted DCC family thiol-disulfide oxidoreductase YuxK
MKRNQPIVYFDGACPLCAREIALYRKAAGAGAVTWCDVSRETTPGDLTPDAALARFHVRLPDGHLVSGARAFIALWLSLPRWRWLGRIASIPPLPGLLEFAYVGFLKLRRQLRGGQSHVAPHPAFGHLLPLQVREKATSAKSFLPILPSAEGARRADEGPHAILLQLQAVTRRWVKR